MNDETGGEVPDRSKRIYVLWAAGFAFLGLLAIFCVYFLRPYVEVREAVRHIDKGSSCADAVKFLGGPEKAVARCTLYVRLPEKLAAREDKSRAFAILGACGQPAFPWLVSLLRSRDEYVRANAASVLGYLGDPRAAEPLSKRFSNGGPVKGDPRAVEPLIVALKDPSVGVRYMAAWSLGELKDPRAVEPLLAALKDPDGAVRFSAAKALGKAKDLRAVEPLLATLKDSDDGVRWAVALALGELQDPRAMEPLIAALKDSSWRVRYSAADALGKLKAPRAVEPLKALLADPDANVREAAGAAIKKIEASAR